MRSSHTIIETYRGPSTGFKTIVTVSNKLPYGQGFMQAQINIKDGQMYYILTDGYKYLGIQTPVRNNLKSAINIVEHHLLKEVV